MLFIFGDSTGCYFVASRSSSYGAVNTEGGAPLLDRRSGFLVSL
jgi:hypothetical protein